VRTVFESVPRRPVPLVPLPTQKRPLGADAGLHISQRHRPSRALDLEGDAPLVSVLADDRLERLALAPELAGRPPEVGLLLGEQGRTNLVGRFVWLGRDEGRRERRRREGNVRWQRVLRVGRLFGRAVGAAGQGRRQQERQDMMKVGERML
jgi:hypothetical protein